MFFVYFAVTRRRSPIPFSSPALFFCMQIPIRHDVTPPAHSAPVCLGARVSGDACDGRRFYQESVACLVFVGGGLGPRVAPFLVHFGGLGGPEWLPCWCMLGVVWHPWAPWARSLRQDPLVPFRAAPFLGMLAPKGIQRGSQNKAEKEKKQTHSLQKSIPKSMWFWIDLLSDCG